MTDFDEQWKSVMEEEHFNENKGKFDFTQKRVEEFKKFTGLEDNELDGRVCLDFGTVNVPSSNVICSNFASPTNSSTNGVFWLFVYLSSLSYPFFSSNRAFAYKPNWWLFIGILNTVKSVNIPVIACGGVGDWEDFADAFEETSADAVAAANIFHYRDQSVFLAKKHLFDSGINVRKPDLIKI